MNNTLADAEWTLVVDRLPPAGVEVETKLDDEHGARNEQTLIYKSGLWWIADMSMYLYYVPTHWRVKQESK